MSVQEQNIPYGPGAYRADGIPDLPPSKDDRAGLMHTPLHWGHYAGLDPATEVEYQLNAELQKAYERQEQEKRPQHIFCDSQRWRFENISKIPHLLFVTKWMCFFFPWIFWAVKLGVLLDLASSDSAAFFWTMTTVGIAFGSMFLFGTRKQHYAYWLMVAGAALTAAVISWHHGALWGFWYEQTAFWWGMFLFFMALIGADALLGLYARFYEHDGSEFSRQAGTLAIARRLRKPFVAPFYEFDPVMQLMVTPHGGHDYALWLHHRYTGTKVCLAGKLHSLGLDKANLLAFWDCLQRYMDVQQPLPDLPVLEQSRHLDPVTAAHDAATKRPPRYWRDIDAKAWLRKEGKRLREKLAAYPLQEKPCILQARIDPGLSIEAYYRRQEAKGIQATPKGGDFDDVHRG
jgi:hypothetical protein